jgi:hypothetical protein
MPAKLLATCPAPRSPTSLANMKDILLIQATGKNIGTCIVLQSPSATPGALFRIRRHSIVFGWDFYPGLLRRTQEFIIILLDFSINSGNNLIQLSCCFIS